MPKVAILLRGGVGKAYGKLGQSSTDLYRDSEYINFYSVEKSFKKHILENNPEYECDFFIHCWNVDLEDKLVDLYKPKKYLFEDNSLYTEDIQNKLDQSGCTQASGFGEISVSLSIKKGCELIESYVEETGTKYDRVMIGRPDYLYWKDMNFESYIFDTIYGSQYGQLDGESHYIMNYDNMTKFKNLYDTISTSLQPNVHVFMRSYVMNILNLRFSQDDFTTGVDHESVRKLRYNIENGTLDENLLTQYGLSKDEIYTYNAD